MIYRVWNGFVLLTLRPRLNSMFSILPYNYYDQPNVIGIVFITSFFKQRTDMYNSPFCGDRLTFRYLLNSLVITPITKSGAHLNHSAEIPPEPRNLLFFMYLSACLISSTVKHTHSPSTFSLLYLIYANSRLSSVKKFSWYLFHSIFSIGTNVIFFIEFAFSVLLLLRCFKFRTTY